VAEAKTRAVSLGFTVLQGNCFEPDELSLCCLDHMSANVYLRTIIGVDGVIVVAEIRNALPA
jgi:hypothetical protein